MAMVLIYYLFLIFRFIGLSKCSEQSNHIQIIDTLAADYYGTRRIIFLRDNFGPSTARFDIKAASKAGLSSVVLNFPVFLGLPHDDLYPKPIVVVTAGRSALVPYAQLSHQVEMSDFHWLVFTDAGDESFANFSLPYNCKFVVVSESFYEVVLKELYKISEGSSLLHNTLSIWIKNLQFTLPKTGFYFRRMNFMGQQLKYLTHEIDPCKRPSFANRNILTCIDEKVWLSIVEALNATTEPVVKSNRNPHFALEMFRRDKNIQISLTSQFMFSGELLVMSYLWPSSRSQLNVYVQYTTVGTSWAQYLQPFTTNIWVIVVSWMAICCLSLLLSRLIAVAFLHPSDTREGCRREQMWTPIFALFSQGSAEPAESGWERLLLISVFMTTAVLVPAYSAALTSFLAVQIPIVPFRSLTDMIDHPEYRLTGSKPYNMREYLASRNDATSQYLRDIAFLNYEDQPASERDAIKRMCNEKLAIIGTTNILTEMKPTCNYYSLTNAYFTFHQAMNIPRNSPYFNTFNIILRSIAFSRILKRIGTNTTMRSLFVAPKGNDSEAPSISFDNIVLLLYLLCVALFTAVVILTVEIFISRSSMRLCTLSNVQ